MNANKERDIMWLRVHTIHEIRCSNCGGVDTCNGFDEYDAVDQFQRKGWREVDYKIYCPNCAKKLNN